MQDTAWGDIFAQQDWLHMNTYSVFPSPRLQTGSQAEEKAKDRGKLANTGIRQLFGKDILPNFCSSTPKLSNGLQYSEGQDVTLKCHNQSARYKVVYSDEDKKTMQNMEFAGKFWQSCGATK